MKIQSKEVKVGDIAKDGNYDIKVERIEKGTLKNGTPTITFFGTRLQKTIRSKASYTRNRKVTEMPYDFTTKAETWVLVN